MELLIILAFFIFIILNSKIVEGSIFSKAKKLFKAKKSVTKAKKRQHEATKTVHGEAKRLKKNK